jgi:hypothetical protein
MSGQCSSICVFYAYDVYQNKQADLSFTEKVKKNAVWQQCVFINADIELGNTTKW